LFWFVWCRCAGFKISACGAFKIQDSKFKITGFAGQKNFRNDLQFLTICCKLLTNNITFGIFHFEFFYFFLSVIFSF